MSDPSQTPVASQNAAPGVESSQLDATRDIWHGIFNNVPAPTTAQTPAWGAQSQVDPNTGAPTAAAPAAATPAPTSYADMWAQAPSGNAPVRTWNDPATAGTDQGQFAQAWYDQATQSANPGDAEAMSTSAPTATPLTGLISALQANPNGSAMSSGKQTATGYQNGNDPTSGDGTGGGPGGDGNDGSSGVGGGIGGSGNSAGDGNSGDGGNGTGGGGDGGGSGASA